MFFVGFCKKYILLYVFFFIYSFPLFNKSSSIVQKSNKSMPFFPCKTKGKSLIPNIKGIDMFSQIIVFSPMGRTCFMLPNVGW